VKRAQEQQIKVKLGFFNELTADEIRKELGFADFIVATNVVCHIPNIIQFFQNVFETLSENGFFIFEEPYLGEMIQICSFDQIYDEHIYMFSVSSIKKLLKKVGLELIDVKPQTTHGGSMRYVARKIGISEPTGNVNALLTYEETLGLSKIETYRLFADECELKSRQLKDLLVSLRNVGEKVYGYGATSKSTTLLNFADISSDLVIAISDSTSDKVGKYTPGTNIPVISPARLRELEPDYVIIFAWNHFQEILEKETLFKTSKTKIISLVPNVAVLEMKKENA
jgi:methylation protein EvaC